MPIIIKKLKIILRWNLFLDKDTFPVLVRSIRCVSLIGNPVKIGSGPAAVIGDEICEKPLLGRSRAGRCRK